MSPAFTQFAGPLICAIAGLAAGSVAGYAVGRSRRESARAKITVQNFDTIQVEGRPSVRAVVLRLDRPGRYPDEITMGQGDDLNLTLE